MPLTDTQIEQFYRDGYIVAPRLVPEPSIDAVVAEEKKIPAVPGGGWTAKIFDFDKPLVDVPLHRLLIEPAIVSAVEQIFDAPARLYYGMVAIVPAHGGKGLEWHQDNMYDLVQGRALNVFIACCDITPDKAILWVAPGSHRLGVQESLTTEGHRVARPPANGQPLPGLKKCDVIIFDRNLLHHSKRNDTPDHRYAYAAQYMEEKSRDPNGRRHTKPLVTDLAALWRQHNLPPRP